MFRGSGAEHLSSPVFPRALWVGREHSECSLRKFDSSRGSRSQELFQSYYVGIGGCTLNAFVAGPIPASGAP